MQYEEAREVSNPQLSDSPASPSLKNFIWIKTQAPSAGSESPHLLSLSHLNSSCFVEIMDAKNVDAALGEPKINRRSDAALKKKPNRCGWCRYYHYGDVEYSILLVLPCRCADLLLSVMENAPAKNAQTKGGPVLMEINLIPYL